MRLIDADALHGEIRKWPESVMYKDWVQSAIANAPTIAPPPNTPLTPEELREMGGEPYWHMSLQEDSSPPHWIILDPYFAKNIEEYGYGKTWLAYRRKPEEGAS